MSFTTLSESLRLARKNAGFTQKQVADHLNISERAYQHYELGTREPNNKTLVRLSKLFNVPLALLAADDFYKNREDILRLREHILRNMHRDLGEKGAEFLNSISSMPDDLFLRALSALLLEVRFEGDEFQLIYYV